MRRGKSHIEVWILENEYDYVSYNVEVDWEYDPSGGNEVRPYWFDYSVKYPEFLNEYQREKIDAELRDMTIDEIMTTEYN